MNVIQIVCDTLRKDHLGCYGNEWIHTPNLDQLAAEAVLFERARTGSLPTLPNRNDLFTGRYAFRKYSWQALPAGETTLAEILSAAGVKTQMIVDTPHLISNGRNYERGFDGWEWIRGQEDEIHRSFPREPELPEQIAKYRNPHTGFRQYLRNVHRRRTEEEADYFPALTSAAAIEWLEENAGDGPFFLHLDFFDPHEPFDPPPGYAEQYPMDELAPRIIYPRYDLSDYLTPGELMNIRALYAGEVSLVDRYVGRLLGAVDSLGLREKTAVIFTADHGYFHGEHGLIGKAIPSPGGKTGHEEPHFYREVADVPLLIRAPGLAPRRTGALVQPVDLTATVLELAGLIATPAPRKAPALFPAASELTPRGKKAAEALGFDPRGLHGRSLAPVLRGKTDAHREIAVTGYSLKFPDPLMARSAITDGEWVLHYSGRYGSGRQRSKLWPKLKNRKSGFKGEITPLLHHLPTDPGEERNLLERGTRMPGALAGVDVRERARELHAAYVRLLKGIETPKEYLKGRRWFPKG